jgi:hypothetical protein
MVITAEDMIITVGRFITINQPGKSIRDTLIPTIIGRNTEVEDIAVLRVSMKRLKAKEIELQKNINGHHRITIAVEAVVIPGLHLLQLQQTQDQLQRLNLLQRERIRNLSG